MLELLDLSSELLKILSKTLNDGSIKDKYADSIRDCCTNKLDEIGYDENYELTKDGIKLNSLIDKLFIG